ncbi:MAG: alpha/beta hydrolase [Clostridia bacterium]|nr:alpha/beta hydrolase [Clostridia bacterium]
MVNPQIKLLSADTSNKLVFKIEVRDKKGEPVSKAHVALEVNNNIGALYPQNARTDKDGELIVSYIPPAASAIKFNDRQNVNVSIKASIYNSDISSSVDFSLTRVPLVFVHGYQEVPEIFSNMKEYLSSKGYECSAIDYRSKDGVVASSKYLSDYLQKQKMTYLTKGMQVGKFDILSHSMGGLVTRYYTSSDNYIRINNINKVIFISVPHKGSHLAPLGASYIQDQGLKDLFPDNELITKTLPGMLNEGLNYHIQVGSILGQFDEVVTTNSASLDDWDIKTEIFNVGENNFTMDNILNGYIMKAPNHNLILNNKKVFVEIEKMLNTELPYPSQKK